MHLIYAERSTLLATVLIESRFDCDLDSSGKNELRSKFCIDGIVRSLGNQADERLTQHRK